MNTAMIVATQMADNQTGTFAARACANWEVTVNNVVYGDWYLPSQLELEKLHFQKIAVGGFINSNYWSSTEGVNQTDANATNFSNGNQTFIDKSTACQVVRSAHSNSQY